MGRKGYVLAERSKFKRLYGRFRAFARSRLPPGVRLIVGILLIGGGILGFLPILGFWMIPLGFSVAALDVVPFYRRLRKRFQRN